MTVSCVFCYIYHAISGRGFLYNFVECVCKNVAMRFLLIYAEKRRICRWKLSNSAIRWSSRP
jgi:hypothetical protein